MYDLVNVLGRRYVLRMAVAAAAAALLAGCSSDVTRFSQDPFSNPFDSASRSTDESPVGSIRQSGGTPYAVAQSSSAGIVSQPLAPPAVARYAAPAVPSPHLTAQNSAAWPPPARRDRAAWSAVGGTPIVVARGETAGRLAARYGVPLDALLRTNGFRWADQIRPGTRLVIPVSTAAVASARPQRQGPIVARADTTKKSVHRRTVGKRHVAARARPRRTILHFVRGRQPARFAERTAVAKSHTKARRLAGALRPRHATEQGRAAPPKETALVHKRAHAGAKSRFAESHKPAGSKVAATHHSRAPRTVRAETASLGFRWPAHGRIIRGFKAGGNDGINIAVPEGTAVKAVEGGVVAYAGDELKGYGNLVLIRHPNGFVSAYADNKSLMVKRGERVRRGQVIAKSGDTGDVTSPQLHFELRKGAKPVNPMHYLAKL